MPEEIPWDLIREIAPVGFSLVALLVTLLVFRQGQARRMRKMDGAFELGTARMTGFFPVRLEGLFLGYRCRYHTEQRSNHSPGAAVLSAAVSASDTWMVRTKGVGSRSLMRLGLLRSVEVGDDDLDQRLRFSAADPAQLAMVFGAARARESLRRLSQTINFRSLAVRKGLLSCRWSPRTPELDDDTEQLRRRLEALTKLAADLGYPPSL